LSTGRKEKRSLLPLLKVKKSACQDITWGMESGQGEMPLKIKKTLENIREKDYTKKEVYYGNWCLKT
jgi:hypothetical protein